MQSINKKKGGFTLVEMLIVIVIIGILASALIPRLNNARGRANDTARKAALQQVSAVMVSYSIDHGYFPGDAETAYALETLKPELEEAGISSIPTDPVADRIFVGIAAKDGGSACSTTNTVISDGEYGYVPIKKNGLSKGGFVLMAGTETIGGSNSVYHAGGCLEADLPYDEVELCTSITETKDATIGRNDGACIADTDEDDLRYIYLY